MMSKVFLSTTLLSFYALPAWSQGDVRVWSARSDDAPTTNEIPSAPAADPSAVDPTKSSFQVAPGDDERAAAEVEELRKKAAQDPTVQLGVQIDQDLLELQKAVDGGASSFDILRSDKLRQNLIQAFEKNPLRDMPPELIEKELLKSTAAPLFKQMPSTMKFMVNFMKHPKALSQLVRSFDRREAWRNCLAASLTVMVLLFFFKKKVTDKKTKWWKSALLSICCTLFLSCFSLGLALIVFGDEFAPTIEVLKQTLF